LNKEGDMADATKKTTDTAGKDLPAPARRRTSPLAFFTEVRRETSKVTWPTWKETWLTSTMVFIMVIITMVFFFGVDLVFSYGQKYFVSFAG
jgi:preprotein translocase subunit SecE